MRSSAFGNLHWGFLLIMVDFRINGFDLLPDVAGYILFAVALGVLSETNEYFAKAREYNLPTLVLSVLGFFDLPLRFIVGLAMSVLSLLTVYNLFMGIRDLATTAGKPLIANEAQSRWNQYLALAVASWLILLQIFGPALSFVFSIAILLLSLILAVSIMGFMNRCQQEL